MELTWFFYNLLLIILAPIWVPWMLWRARKRKEPPNWQERTGNYQIAKRQDRKRIWMHAVSVGEVMAARPILRELRKQLPDYEFVLTCTTSTGHEIAESIKGTLCDHVFYFPIDIPRFCMAALMRVEPAVAVIMETELWLNFLSSAKGVRAKTCLCNGRISDRSFARSRWFRFLYRSIFSKIDENWMQTESDAARARYFSAKNVQVIGNSKYDEAGNMESRNWRGALGIGNAPLVVVGSVRGDEEETFVLSALRGTKARIIFAPRHPERGKAIHDKAEQLGFDAGLRSKGENTRPFLILDTIGELASIYAEADIAVIGGGFSNLGGQNIIQPMAAGCAVICGPNMQNFRQPYEDGVAAGAIRTASTPDELSQAIDLLLQDEQPREAMGIAGKTLVAKHVGSSERYAKNIATLALQFERERTR